MSLKLSKTNQTAYSITDTDASEVTSGTTLTGSVTAAARDFVLATIAVRSALTLPEGWTLLYTSPAIGTSQTLSFAYKEITESGTVNLTVTQATAGRIYLNLISIAGINGLEYDSVFTVVDTSGISGEINVQDKVAGNRLIWGCTANFWTVGQEWSTTPADLTKVGLGMASGERLANFIDDGSGTATGRTITTGNLTTTTYAIAAVRMIITYETEGTAIYGPYVLPEFTHDAELTVTCGITSPANTSVSLSYGTAESGQPESWTTITNETAATMSTTESGENLYIKLSLGTTDAEVTPSVNSLSYRLLGEIKDNMIRVTLDYPDRMKYPQGEVTIEYIPANGNLTGEQGGAVVGFTEIFTPTGITPFFNPNGVEKIEITATTVTATKTRIYYTDGYTTEKAEIASATVTATLTHVDDLP